MITPAPNSSQLAKRREREKQTMSHMTAIYCNGNHKDRAKGNIAFCGEHLCDECAEIDRFSIEKIEQCRNFETKTTCAQCPNKCYSPQQRADMKKVMRYSGPRMLLHHPIETYYHAKHS